MTILSINVNQSLVKPLSSGYSGAVSVFKGACTLAAQIPKNPDTQPFKAIKAADILSASIQILSGTLKASANAINLAVASLVTAIKTDLIAVSTIFSTVASGLGAFLSAINLVQPSIKIEFSKKLMIELQNSDSSMLFELNNLKSLAPKTSVKIESTVTQVTLTDEIKKEMIEELNRSIVDSSVSIGVLLLTLGSCSIGFAPLGCAGVIAAAVIGILAKVVSTTTSGINLIESLKKTKEISKSDFILKIVTIVLSIVSLVLSVIFSSTLAIAIPTALVGLLAVSISIASLALSKSK